MSEDVQIALIHNDFSITTADFGEKCDLTDVWAVCVAVGSCRVLDELTKFDKIIFSNLMREYKHAFTDF